MVVVRGSGGGTAICVVRIGGSPTGCPLGLLSTVKLAAFGLPSVPKFVGRKQAASLLTTKADSVKVTGCRNAEDLMRPGRLATRGRSVLIEGVGRGTEGTNSSETVRRKDWDSEGRLPRSLEW